eukprot:CAMPEP_0167784608 /NCGR_PEP_ID=MMETSP0111_2-20121227/7737_1 /TAXON_ID=91324 /ORGANISM="Lotharella globosa, Strain CCCM811" /LENGTH=375 /DNA_ID=CAMNT_0007675709 /DNA_START=11 /DNA_END=1138 /DNA_ORIENTATION=-
MQRISRIASHLLAGTAATPPSGDAKTPVKVVVTGAAGRIGYSLLFFIGNGRLLGPDIPVDLRLLEIPGMEKKLEGIAMELRDGAFPIVKKLTATTDPSTAFDGCQIALLVGAMPRKGNMTRADLLKKNAGIFKAQGRLINKYADRDVKVLVVGNPANANAMVAAHYAPDIPKANFHALTRLDQNRAVSMLGEKLGCDASKIRNAIVWGNHSSTMYPDVNSGHVSTSSGTKPLREAINDNKWLETSFLKAVRGRGSAIIKALGASSAASAANAACDHIRDWFLGTPQDKYVSMSVPSDGSYGVPEGIVFSFPCICKPGMKYEIVKGLHLDDYSKKLIKISADGDLSPSSPRCSHLCMHDQSLFRVPIFPMSAFLEN